MIEKDERRVGKNKANSSPGIEAENYGVREKRGVGTTSLQGYVRGTKENVSMFQRTLYSVMNKTSL